MDQSESWPIWALILTSAGVGAIASAVVTAISQWLERRSRRGEVLLAKSIEMANELTRTGKEIAEKQGPHGSKVTLLPTAYLAAIYFKFLRHLLIKGDAPKSFLEDVRLQMKKKGVDISDDVLFTGK